MTDIQKQNIEKQKLINKLVCKKKFTPTSYAANILFFSLIQQNLEKCCIEDLGIENEIQSFLISYRKED